MTTFEKINLPEVKNIIVIASGKGGVGKSTVSANLAIALARQGFKVGLMDADLYGPSIPRMFGIENEKLEMTASADKEMMYPVERYGVKIMSVGFLIAKEQGLIWRGPLAAKGLMELFENTFWGEIDYLVVDFPPGTGDIQLSTVQNINISGAIMVTTPQEIALNDARKAASLFVNTDVNIPILGVVENMAWFTPKEHPDEKYFLFGQGGGEKLAAEFNTKLLGQIPLVIGVGEAAEKGLSAFNQTDRSVITAFEGIVEQLANYKSL